MTDFDDKKLRQIVASLKRDNGEIAKKIYRLMTGKSESEVILTLKKSALSRKYSKLAGAGEGKVSLVFYCKRLRHLIKRGHLTGKAEVGDDDAIPLRVTDLKKMAEVFCEPDTVRRDVSGKIEVSKKVNGEPLRLILYANKSFSRLSVVSYYNCTPLKLKRRLLRQRTGKRK